MTIRVTNATYQSASAGEFDTLEDAYRAAVAAGLEIAAGEISGGQDSAVVEVSVDLVGRKDAMRGMVAASTARLLVAG